MAISEHPEVRSFVNARKPVAPFSMNPVPALDVRVSLHVVVFHASEFSPSRKSGKICGVMTTGNPNTTEGGRKLSALRTYWIKLKTDPTEALMVTLTGSLLIIFITFLVVLVQHNLSD